MDDWLYLDEASRELGGKPTASSLRRMCNNEEMYKHGPSRQVPWGLRQKWQIHRSTLDSLKGGGDDYADLLAEWERDQLNGFHTGRRLAATTVSKNLYGMACLWRFLEAEPKTSLITVDNVRRAISLAPANSIPQHIYKGAMSFYKLLIRKGLRSQEDMARFSDFKPVENKNPRRTSLKSHEAFLEMALTNSTWKRGRTEYDRVLTGAILKTLYYTGMRNFELCGLTMADLNMEESTLLVHGKGGEDRPVGVHPELKTALAEYLQHRPKGEMLFLQEDGRPVRRSRVWRRISNLGQKCGIDITPHGLRATWATRLLGGGQPINLVARAGGWKKLSTMQKYDRSEAVDALDMLRGRAQKTPEFGHVPRDMHTEFEF